MRKALCHICFLFAAIQPLAAQTDSGGDSRRVPGRSAWFACTSIPDGIEKTIKVLGGKDITEVELLEYMASDPVRIPEDGIIRIVREVPDPENRGKLKYLTLAEARIPDNVREALIILFPLPKSEGALIFQAKVQDLAAFKGGDRLFINLSDTNVGVKIGPTSVAVLARQANIYSAPKLAKSANMPIIYQFYHPVQKKWKLLSASTVVIVPTRRKICIFNNGSRVGHIKRHDIIFPVQRKAP